MKILFNNHNNVQGKKHCHVAKNERFKETHKFSDNLWDFFSPGFCVWESGTKSVNAVFFVSSAVEFSEGCKLILMYLIRNSFVFPGGYFNLV